MPNNKATPQAPVVTPTDIGGGGGRGFFSNRPLPSTSPMTRETISMERKMIQLARDRGNMRALKSQLRPESYKRMMDESFRRMQQARNEYMNWYSRNRGWLWE